MFDEQTKKTTTTPILHPPPLPYPLPHPRPVPPLSRLLPTSLNRLVPRVSSAPLVLRIAFLQWKPRPLLRERGNRLPNGFPAARMMKSLSPRSDGRPLVWRVTSVGNARSLAGNHQKAVSTGPASKFFLFSSTPATSVPFLVSGI